MIKALTYTCLFTIFFTITFSRGIQGQKAPIFEVEHWVDKHGKPLSKKPKIKDYKGKMLYIYCWQYWCPGCRNQGFPTLKKLYKKYGKNKNIEFLAIQTTFEGNHVNTLDKVPEIIAKYDLQFPVGHTQAQPGEEIPYFMYNYRTGGTPWGILIGPDQTVLINDYELEYDRVESLLDEYITDLEDESEDATR